MKHQTISFVKSAIRLLGYVCMLPVAPFAAIVLIVSEWVGIMEEIGHD